MPPPARTPALPPPAPTVTLAPQVLSGARPAAGTRPASTTTAARDRVPAATGQGVRRAQGMVGNAAVAASLAGVPPNGFLPGVAGPAGLPPAVAAPMLPHAQHAVGNGATAAGLVAAAPGLRPAPANSPAPPEQAAAAALGAGAPAVAEPGRGPRPVREEPAGGGKARPGARPGPDRDPKFAALATGMIHHPDDMCEDDRLDAETVLVGLLAFRNLLALAVQRGLPVECWGE